MFATMHVSVGVGDGYTLSDVSPTNTAIFNATDSSGTLITISMNSLALQYVLVVIPLWIMMFLLIALVCVATHSTWPHSSSKEGKGDKQALIHTSTSKMASDGVGIRRFVRSRGGSGAGNRKGRLGPGAARSEDEDEESVKQTHKASASPATMHGDPECDVAAVQSQYALHRAMKSATATYSNGPDPNFSVCSDTELNEIVMSSGSNSSSSSSK